MTTPKFLFFFYDRAHFHRFLWSLVFLAIFAGTGLIFVPDAQAQVFNCVGSLPTGNLFDQDTLSNTINDKNGLPAPLAPPSVVPTANDDPFTSGVCSNTLGVFGRVVCFFRSTVGQIVSSMYCTLQSQLLVPLSVALELFVVLIGLAIFTGMSKMTVRDGITALLKVALVWTFAANATWGIGIAYAFFMGLAEEGTSILLGAVGGNAGGQYLTQPDKVVTSLLNYVTMGNSGANPLLLPSLASPGPGGVFNPCGAWIFTILLVVFIALPMVAGAIISLIIQYLWLYAKALLGYLTALILISFLFILSPIFISFALFQITRPIFEQWLKYLTSFSLQMVIVFGFLALLGLLPVGDFFMEITGLLTQYSVTYGGVSVAMPQTMCSVCQFTLNSALTLGNGPPYPIACVPGGGAIPWTKLFTQFDLVQVIVTQAVALSIIGKVMMDFMENAPEFARQLSGRLPFAALLGGGASSLGDAPSIDYLGMDSLDRGISGLENKLSSSSTWEGWKRVLPAGLLAAPLLASASKNQKTYSSSPGFFSEGPAPTPLFGTSRPLTYDFYNAQRKANPGWLLTADGSAFAHDMYKALRTANPGWMLTADGKAFAHDMYQAQRTANPGWMLTADGKAFAHDMYQAQRTANPGWMLTADGKMFMHDMYQAQRSANPGWMLTADGKALTHDMYQALRRANPDWMLTADGKMLMHDMYQSQRKANPGWLLTANGKAFAHDMYQALQSANPGWQLIADGKMLMHDMYQTQRTANSGWLQTAGGKRFMQDMQQALRTADTGTFGIAYFNAASKPLLGGVGGFNALYESAILSSQQTLQDVARLRSAQNVDAVALANTYKKLTEKKAEMAYVLATVLDRPLETARTQTSSAAAASSGVSTSPSAPVSPSIPISSGAPSSPVTIATGSATSLEEMNYRINLAVESLDIQIQINQQLNPGDDVDRARQDLDQIMQTLPQATQTMEGQQIAMQQLYSVFSVLE